ncbi:MAG: universal stress protein [archaeon]|nr:universal stress protein [archaeon]
MPTRNPQRNRIRLPKKILMAVDGSESAYRAADYALALAKKLDSIVYFVHVVDISPYPLYKEDVSDYVEVEGSFEDRGNEILSNCMKKARSKNVEAESFLEVGDPSHQIVQFAIDKKCDCIVMGKRGLGKLERILIGSITDQVTKLASIPSIIVK